MGNEPLAGTLVLEDRTSFRGRLHGYARSVSGEVVFNTGMVGYTEALTDPSYSGQILTLTYPLVGNYGVPPSFESRRIQATALIVSELASDCSHASAEGSLADWLRREEIPCLSGIDTRALTKRLRDKGAMLGKIVLDGEDVPFDDPNCRDVVAEVGSRDRIVYPGGDRTVVLVDCGAKASIIEKLRARGLTIIRVPSDYDFLGEDFDGVLVSNGPGDPRSCRNTIRHLTRALRARRPIMGICLGHQLLALAAGANTYKLKFGHRGHNQPCLEEGTGRCFITSQNHGFAVDPATLPAGWEAWFTNANDGSNEGMRHRSEPFLSVQFHPEAAPGPLDCEPLFDEFVGMMR
ncbi:MAG TPA: glutamine-hydrolyzing carbamoyl-phosphate synthase small subunit [Vicinamibacterales bacterium]|nr:glutamine-hydrolyzing carbamoyl-phosphate synthase small subunit [Vicinamibacterales bacterium]